MSALAHAPTTTTQYACTECTHAPFRNRRAVAIHLVRAHGLKSDQARQGKAVVIEVPLEAAPAADHKILHAVEGYHTTALRIPMTHAAQLDAMIAERGSGNQAEIVREAIAFFLAAHQSDTWKDRYVVEHRKRLAAEENMRRMQVGVLSVRARLAEIARG